MYSEFVAAPLTFTIVGDGKVLLTANCSSYFWKIVPAGTLELLQSNRGVRLVTDVLLTGAANTGTLGNDEAAVGGMLVLAGIKVTVGGMLVLVGINVAIGGILVLVGAGVAVDRPGVINIPSDDQTLYSPSVL